MKLQGILTIILAFVISETNAEIMKDDSLSEKEKSIISIAALTAKGDLPNLKIAFNTGLEDGLTINEIKEELIHLSAYCGFPRSLNGINTLSAVLDDRKSKGITDQQGETPLRVKEVGKYEAGKEVLQSLTGRVETGPRSGYATFVPAIDTLLKEHLFNDIFTRGVLDYKQRELITVSVLATLGGVDSQLSGHIGICLNLGISKKQLEELLFIVADKVGNDRAVEARKILERVSTRTNR
ncbi:carboxymuconolactone decarboxylase family protein [Dyadobacter jiangsuensis]|uniref:Alkylhydroperoxidase/carboxymuconolactone decarboxylase family protein YurZ n=1 Tax=Dyadobacter jiangsuensis TaxID=1591085 RepID=A0A2P8GC58_9BACT|nr:carboxymuconolactone decarboxylase family protein [Dyadobacter jiangsuensis]PSL31564.1 alkylhydroperoxidase/carboxymuconolactone decarboxylase family protein YurZ [Dyadobacter jiangsuensis]